jgi:mycothiol synthase
MPKSKHFEDLKELVVRPATLEDLEQAVEFLNLYSLATIGVKEYDLETLRREWTVPGFELATNSRVVLTQQGEWVGYIDVWDVDDPPVKVGTWGCVHPDHQGRGIGTALQAWAEARAREALHRVPEDARASIRMGAPSTNEAATNLFQQRGAKLVRRYWDMVVDLTAPLAKPVLPEGLHLITFDEFNDLEALYRADIEAFRDHWGFVEEPFESGFKRWAHWMTSDDSFDPKLWFLGMDGEEIAGLILCKEKTNEDPEMGWVRILGVRRPWRRRGLGLALLRHAFAEIKQRGKKRAGLGVDSGSLTGATRLYDKAGMKVKRIYDSYEIEMQPGKELARVSLEE